MKGPHCFSMGQIKRKRGASNPIYVRMDPYIILSKLMRDISKAAWYNKDFLLCPIQSGFSSLCSLWGKKDVITK